MNEHSYLEYAVGEIQIYIVPLKQGRNISHTIYLKYWEFRVLY